METRKELKQLISSSKNKKLFQTGVIPMNKLRYGTILIRMEYKKGEYT